MNERKYNDWCADGQVYIVVRCMGKGFGAGTDHGEQRYAEKQHGAPNDNPHQDGDVKAKETDTPDAFFILLSQKTRHQ